MKPQPSNLAIAGRRNFLKASAVGLGDGRGCCPAFIAAGTHETRFPVFVRDPSTGGCATGTPPAYLGLRLIYIRQQMRARFRNCMMGMSSLS
jgi:hypothetical protein